LRRGLYSSAASWRDAHCQSCDSEQDWDCPELPPARVWRSAISVWADISQNSLMDRISMLTELLTQDPNNAFARYGLAMEYSNSGELDRALEEFGRLLSAHRDYTAGYFMAAQTLVKAQRMEEAKKMLKEGIASAQLKRDAHAESEMQAMLEELSV
jgi:predicted Zn-dependent protease